MTEVQRTQQLLTQLGISSERIRVLGNGKLINVICIGRDTADKWVMALQTAFAGYKVNTAPFVFNAAANKDSQLSPTKRAGFIVSALAA